MKTTVIHLFGHYGCRRSRQCCSYSKACRTVLEKLVDLLLIGAIATAAILIVLLLLV